MSIAELGGAVPPQQPGIFLGTAGWPDDGGAVVDLADSSNDGSNLVKVALFDAAHVPDDTDDTQARGTLLTCRLADNVQLPARGTTVVVAVPAGIGHVPGAPVIIGTLSNNPQAQANLKPGEAAITAPDGRATIFLRSGGRIVFRVIDDHGNASILAFSPTSLRITDTAYTVTFDTTGMRLRHFTGASIKMGGYGLPSPLSSLSAYVTVGCGVFTADASLVQLGPSLGGVQTYLPAAYGPDPSPAPLLATGIKSASVKLAP